MLPRAKVLHLPRLHPLLSNRQRTTTANKGTPATLQLLLVVSKRTSRVGLMWPALMRTTLWTCPRSMIQQPAMETILLLTVLEEQVGVLLHQQ